jgi:hypothetical protein
MQQAAYSVRHVAGQRQLAKAFFFERAVSSACLAESIFTACVILLVLVSGRFAPATGGAATPPYHKSIMVGSSRRDDREQRRSGGASLPGQIVHGCELLPA